MKWVFWIFIALYGLAVLLFLIGVFGWLGQDKDPISAAFLLPLGLPWNIVADKAGLPGAPALVLSPALNAALIFWLWTRRRRYR